MSSFACPGCGEDAPLSEACKRCEFEAGVLTEGGELAWPRRLLLDLLKRLQATRAAFIAEADAHQSTIKTILAERAESYAELGPLRAQTEGLRADLRVATSFSIQLQREIDECSRLRDLAIRALELRTKELLAAESAFDELRAEHSTYRDRLARVLKPRGDETALTAIELAQWRMNQLAKAQEPIPDMTPGVKGK